MLKHQVKPAMQQEQAVHSTVNVAQYLFTRLGQLGCLSLHGLPGDFNLRALDFVETSGVRWVGSCNELNAAYAADAYARVRGLGAILTTFGVGELSAINGIAGSYAELVPVVHIVGTPSLEAQKSGALLHHTLGNGNFKVFAEIYGKVTIAQTNLQDPKAAAAEIDRVLQTCFVEARPVYIQLPTDMVTELVDAERLQSPINVSFHKSDKAAEDMAVDIIADRLYKATKPVLLIDGAVERRRATESVRAFIEHLGIPVFVAPMGKGVVDESLPNFVGVYVGDGTQPDIRKAVETSDLVLTVGNIKSDLNTAGFTYRFSELTTISVHYNHVDIGYARFDKVFFKSLLPRLVEAIDPSRLKESAKVLPTITRNLVITSAATDSDTITHEWLWTRMSRFLRPDDLIVAETGTSYVGCWDLKLPKGARIINQMLWSSIGYGVGAAQGAALASKDSEGGQRTLCFEGDGSFQLTAQELSTIIRHGLDVTMFLIENSGYTIFLACANQERFVHGLEAHYNDVPQWKYSTLPAAFTPAASTVKPKTWHISSRSEFDKLLDEESFGSGKGLQFVEIHMPKLDAPQALIDFGKGAEARVG